jgi:hypothetical protein
MRTTLTSFLAALALATATTASATPVGPGAFGPLAVTESFEGHVPGANLSLGLGASLLHPGTASAFAFATGVTLTSPVPNPGFGAGGPFLHDFALGADVQNNWGATGVVNDAGDVPFGDAYLGAFTGAGTTAFELGFGSSMDRVGAFVTGVAGSSVTLEVYGLGGALLETRTVNAVPLAQWGVNFVGIEQLAGIGRVVFRGVDFGIDGLMFEASPVPVPEPGTLSAVALGLTGLLGIAMLGRRPAQRARVHTNPS